MRNPVSVRESIGTTVALAATVLASVLASPAHAEVGASGTRIALPGGAARYYMTYGRADEPELYAPILPELHRLQVSFVPHGNSYQVVYRGSKYADWPIVRSRDDVPETGEEPCVLVMGGNVFVPVRKIAALFSLDVKFQRGENLVALTPAAPKPRPPVATHPTTPAHPAAVAETITLSGLEIQQNGGSVKIRVRSTSPVTPQWLTVRSPSPTRIVLDFPNAKWDEALQIPAGAGEVRTLRVGKFEGSKARLVLEIPSPDVKLTGLYVDKDGVQAMIGRGAEAKSATVNAEASAILEALNRRNGMTVVRRASRGGILDGNIQIEPPTGPDPLIPAVPEQPKIDHPEPLIVQPASSLTGKVICLDAGHGGHSTGAKGLNNLEKDLCLKMCQSFRRELESRGATVVMTRDSDDFVSLEDRCQIANTRKADLFISIHLNSSPVRNSGSGTETYWHTPQSSRLARALHRRVVGAFGGADRGIRTAGFFVIKYTQMPSVLLEIGYINNSHDEGTLSQGNFHGHLAQSLLLGVLDYFGKDATP